MLIKLLIVFFTCLIGYQLFLALTKGSDLVEGLDFMAGKGSENRRFSDLVEGLENDKSTSEYKDYNTNDPNNPNSALILSQQNAGNIEVLRGRIDELDGVNPKIVTMQSNIDSIQTQIDALVQQQADFGTELTGDTPADVSGLDEDEEDPV
jgi:hypothetical protein